MQLLPEVSEAPHEPSAPLFGADTVQALATHVAAANTPELLQLLPLEGVRVKPLLQVGVHVWPAARVLVHVPTPPFVGAADASQTI
jgi:hypothetical protein